jgi:hypothetical protein
MIDTVDELIEHIKGLILELKENADLHITTFPGDKLALILGGDYMRLLQTLAILYDIKSREGDVK